MVSTFADVVHHLATDLVFRAQMLANPAAALTARNMFLSEEAMSALFATLSRADGDRAFNSSLDESPMSAWPGIETFTLAALQPIS